MACVHTCYNLVELALSVYNRVFGIDSFQCNIKIFSQISF